MHLCWHRPRTKQGPSTGRRWEGGGDPRFLLRQSHDAGAASPSQGGGGARSPCQCAGGPGGAAGGEQGLRDEDVGGNTCLGLLPWRDQWQALPSDLPLHRRQGHLALEAPPLQGLFGRPGVGAACATTGAHRRPCHGLCPLAAPLRWRRQSSRHHDRARDQHCCISGQAGEEPDGFRKGEAPEVGAGAQGLCCELHCAAI
mmetsp:Transcript_120264/g.256693  ORF Transcript_120264/g.256693 Transcript_120264/m.256693 type:complete len:200 (+) Transcript_120264:394-993(+)